MWCSLNTPPATILHCPAPGHNFANTSKSIQQCVKHFGLSSSKQQNLVSSWALCMQFLLYPSACAAASCQMRDSAA